MIVVKAKNIIKNIHTCAVCSSSPPLLQVIMPSSWRAAADGKWDENTIGSPPAVLTGIEARGLIAELATTSCSSRSMKANGGVGVLVSALSPSTGDGILGLNVWLAIRCYRRPPRVRTSIAYRSRWERHDSSVFRAYVRDWRAIERQSRPSRAGHTSREDCNWSSRAFPAPHR